CCSFHLLTTRYDLRSFPTRRSSDLDIWARTAKYLLLSGYLTYRLTGQYVDSVGAQVGYIPFDYKRLRWSGKRDWKWQALPVTPRSEEHTSELQSRENLVCRLLLEKK